METTKLALVYVHLIACCIALGAILKSDFSMALQLLGRGKAESEHDLHQLKRVVSAALIVLWATGTYFVWNEASAGSLVHTLSNPKLQTKIIVVSILTFNGLLLHSRVLPMLTQAGSLLRLDGRQRTFVIAAGVLSGVSWMYAAFMGIARPLAWKYPLSQLLQPYPLLVLTGFAGMCLLTTWALRRDAGRSHMA